jgi:hypothetical protein
LTMVSSVLLLLTMVSSVLLLLTMVSSVLLRFEGRRGRDRMIIGFITTYAISAYHH